VKYEYKEEYGSAGARRSVVKHFTESVEERTTKQDQQGLSLRMILKENTHKAMNNVRMKEHIGSSVMAVSLTIQRRVTVQVEQVMPQQEALSGPQGHKAGVRGPAHPCMPPDRPPS